MPLSCSLASYGSAHAKGIDFPELFRLSLVLFSKIKAVSTSETVLGAVDTVLDVQ